MAVKSLRYLLALALYTVDRALFHWIGTVALWLLRPLWSKCNKCRVIRSHQQWYQEFSSTLSSITIHVRDATPSKNRGGGTVFWIGFYADISWESRYSSEIKIWGHLCQILIVFEVPARPQVKGMSKTTKIWQRILKFSLFFRVYRLIELFVWDRSAWGQQGY